jgi:hypothetical protein
VVSRRITDDGHVLGVANELVDVVDPADGHNHVRDHVPEFAPAHRQ